MPKIDPYKWTNGEKPLKSLRPGLAGVYHKDGYKQASSGFIYVRLKEDYPKGYEGKVVYKDGTIINADPPKYDRVTPKMSDYKPYIVDVEYLETVRKKQAEKTRKDPDGLKHNVVLSEKKSGVSVMLDAQLLKRIVEFMQAKHTDTVYLHKENAGYKAVVVESGTGIDEALIMPLLLDYSVDASEVRKRTAVVPLTPEQPSETRIYKAKRVTTAEKTKNKPYKPTTMKRTTKRAATKKAAGTIKRASRILADHKKDYQRMFIRETKKGGNTRQAAKAAGAKYRSKYGATAKSRWKNAIKDAKR